MIALRDEKFFNTRNSWKSESFPHIQEKVTVIASENDHLYSTYSYKQNIDWYWFNGSVHLLESCIVCPYIIKPVSQRKTVTSWKRMAFWNKQVQYSSELIQLLTVLLEGKEMGKSRYSYVMGLILAISLLHQLKFSLYCHTLIFWDKFQHSSSNLSSILFLRAHIIFLCPPHMPFVLHLASIMVTNYGKSENCLVPYYQEIFITQFK